MHCWLMGADRIGGWVNVTSEVRNGGSGADLVVGDTATINIRRLVQPMAAQPISWSTDQSGGAARTAGT